MRDRMFRKGLVIGIIVLFIGVSVFSSVSSKDVSNSDENILENDLESEGNNDGEPLADYFIIFAYISGGGMWESSSGFIIRHIHVSLGGFDIVAYTDDPVNRIHRFHASRINIPRFIGMLIGIAQGYCFVRGFALGHFEWWS